MRKISSSTAELSARKKVDVSCLDLVCYPDPRLRKKSVEVKEFDQWLARLARRMFEVMYASRGVGLAGPQVGVNLRLFVYNEAGAAADGQEIVIVNPVLSDLQGAGDRRRVPVAAWCQRRGAAGEQVSDLCI